MSIEISLVQLPRALTQLHLPELQITSVGTKDQRPTFEVLHKGSKVWEVTLGQIEQNIYVVNHMPPPSPRLVASALRELSKVGYKERQVLRSGRPHGSVLVGRKI